MLHCKFYSLQTTLANVFFTDNTVTVGGRERVLRMSFVSMMSVILFLGMNSFYEG